MNAAVCAVLWPGEKRLSIEKVEIEHPREHEVLVKIAASGICHTDMVMRDQVVPTPQPVVLGHEGAGVVESVGSGVSGFAPGDRVAMSFATCGRCPSCFAGEPAYCYQFFPLNFFGAREDGSTAIRKSGKSIHSHVFGQSSFASHAVCDVRNLVKIDDGVPLELMGPFGCGFQTGAGAVLNSLKVRPESSVMVLGTGTVGTCAVMAAGIAGAATIIAVDVHDKRLELAIELGATHTVNTKDQGLETAVRAISESGVDYIVDTTAHLPLVQEAAGLLAPRGALGLAAAYRPGDKFTFDVMPFMSTGLTVRGIVEGDTDIQSFIPRLVDYYKEGLFPVDRIVSYFDFDDINAAIEATESGDVIKAIVKTPDEC